MLLQNRPSYKDGNMTYPIRTEEETWKWLQLPTKSHFTDKIRILTSDIMPISANLNSEKQPVCTLKLAQISSELVIISPAVPLTYYDFSIMYYFAMLEKRKM